MGDCYTDFRNLIPTHPPHPTLVRHTASLPQLWEEWTTESRREFLADFLHSVTIKSANRKPVPVAERMTILLSGRETELE
jgi:hypothetical protein